MSSMTLIATVNMQENETPAALESRVMDYLYKQDFCAHGRYACSTASHLNGAEYIGIVTQDLYNERLLGFENEIDSFSGGIPHALCTFTDIDQDEVTPAFINTKHMVAVSYHY